MHFNTSGIKTADEQNEQTIRNTSRALWASQHFANFEVEGRSSEAGIREREAAAQVQFSRTFTEGEERDGHLDGLDAQRQRQRPCEDAPCCGCCGPGSDDPAYNESDPYDEDPLGVYGSSGERYFWKCPACGAQNSVEDGDCQFCDESEG